MPKRPSPARGATRAQSVRCAIYTRKSTEEGLEQAFNSLDAQREACAAYITSQRHEGWVAVRDSYDDGGFSGGNMMRPGLKRLLADVEAGKVDVIVVYKVDRLTRALSDFAKIVEILDARGASFVSITQSFNTTTSMGRLTLNVLLSFAQFEREVTGERIRDKIAASKKKGLWMGGNVPLGYDVVDRKLVVNDTEAATVRHILERYVALGTGRALIDELRRTGYRTKRVEREGKQPKGGIPFERGMLFHIMSNRIYLGEMVHAGVAYPGEHQAIVPTELWDAVQQQIAANRVNRRGGDNVREHSLLAGILLDAEGRRMTPSHAVKGARRYRYYVTHDLDRREGDAAAWRVPAQDIETAVVERLRTLLQDRSAIMGLSGGTNAGNLSIALDLAKHAAARLDDARERLVLISALVTQVRLADDHMAIDLDRAKLLDMLGIEHTEHIDDNMSLIARTALIRNGQEVKLVVLPDGGKASANDNLVALLAEAQDAYETVLANPSKTINQLAKDAQRCRTRYAQLVKVAMLAPDIVQRCIAGTQPPALTARTLLSADLPIPWQEQRRMLGCG